MKKQSAIVTKKAPEASKDLKKKSPAPAPAKKVAAKAPPATPPKGAAQKPAVKTPAEQPKKIDKAKAAAASAKPSAAVKKNPNPAEKKPADRKGTETIKFKEATTSKVVKTKAKTPPAKAAPVKKEKIAAKKTAPAKEPKKALKKNQAEAVTKAGAKADLKARSHHLMKILALRDARKIKKPDGAAAAVKPGKAAPVVKGVVPGAVTIKAEVEVVEPPKKKKKVIRKAPYSKVEMKELKKLLTDERERLLHDLRSLDDLADSNRETTHATFSSHQADAASDSSSLESTFIQRRMEEERFAWVTEALVKVDKGTYGLCDLCADEPAMACPTCPFIPVDRLRAKPHAKMCVQMRMQMEKKNRR